MAHLSFISATKLVELLNATNTNKNMHIRVLTTNQLALGIDPLHPTNVIDLSKEELRSISSGENDISIKAPTVPVAKPTSSHKLSRQSGKYLLDIKGRTMECTSLSILLAEGLKALEAHKPGTLSTLSSIQPRTKRIVARDPGGLFLQKDLAEKYSEKLMDGWWFGTNNSADETKTWLKRACVIAELQWGTDFTTSL